jgi:hypothetical protein
LYGFAARADLKRNLFFGFCRLYRGVQKQQQPFSAGIDHSRLFKLRQHVGRALEQYVTVTHHFSGDQAKIVCVLGTFSPFLRQAAGDGQNRALFRFHHGFIRRFRRF